MIPAPPLYAQRIGVFYAGYFAVGGVQVPFLPVWLDYRGLTEGEIAICIAAPLALRVVLTPLSGWMADHLPHRRIAVQVFMALAFLAFGFGLVAEGFGPILAVTAIAFLCWQLALPAAEALALTGVRRFRLDFGRMRLYGSVSFILVNLASGVIVGWLAPGAIYWAILLVLFAGLAVSLGLPVTPPAVRALDDALRPPMRARDLLRHPVFLTLMAVGGLLQCSHAMIYGFGSLHWAAIGFSGLEIGILWAVGVVAEVALFAVSGAAGRRFGATGLMLIGAVAAILRWLLFPLDLGFAGYLALQLLHGLSFGASFLGLQRAILTRVPDAITGTAQSIAAMLGGLLMALTTVVSGPLYGAFGVMGFTAMAIPPLLALAILLAFRFGEGQLQHEETHA